MVFPKSNAHFAEKCNFYFKADYLWQMVNHKPSFRPCFQADLELNQRRNRLSWCSAVKR
jgi:hypothetical protein